MTRRYFTDEQEARIMVRRNAGATYTELIAEFGGTSTAIAGALRRTGAARGRFPRPLTSEQRAAIVAQYRSGTSVRKIATSFRYRTSTISETLEAEGLQIRPGGGHPFFDDDQAAALAFEYQAGASLAKLAREHNTNQKTMRENLLRVGTNMREQSRPVFWTDDRRAEVISLYQQGMSEQKIADRIGTSQAAVSRRLVDAGIVTRTRRRREHHPSWKGGRRVHAGYVWVNPAPKDREYCKVLSSGYVLEHRLVMARALGRPLTRGETVHHINGDRQDNRLANLQLRNGGHGKGVVLACLDCGSHNVQAVPL